MTPDQSAPLIVGVARSGTTLLRLMLDSHPAMAIPPETHFAGRVIRAFEASGGGAERALKEIVDSPFWPDFGICARDLAETVNGSGQVGAGAVLRAFYETYAERNSKPRWGDKTPPYLDQMTSIQEALPEACFVHVIRDGRDVALSAIPLAFGPNSVTEAARSWSSRIEAARRQARDLNRYVEVRYEELVTDSGSVLGRLCEILDLPWDPAMLEYHRRARNRFTELTRDIRLRDGRVISAATRSAMHELVAEPPRPDRLGRWRSEMREDDRLTFERLAGGMLEELGYELR